MHAYLKTHALRCASALLSLSLLATGCSTLYGLYGWTSIHKSARGSVYLREVADWSFEADHPAVIDQATLLSAVKGVVADDDKKPSTKMPASGSKPMRVFSDEDAEFLAPLLAQGLSQAKPEQIVGFTVSPSAGSGAEPAAGTIYLSQGSLYLTIAPTKNRKVTGFAPSTAARIERAPSYAAEWAPGTPAMVIDPQILAKAQTPAAIPVAAEPKPLPASTAPTIPVDKGMPSQQQLSASTQALAANTLQPGAPDSHEMSKDELLSKKLDELQQARETNKMKDSEIATLRKEVESMKIELRERSAESKTSTVSKRSAPKRKSAEAYPTR